jgi:hypothetical protein
MSVYIKLQKARVSLQAKPLSKSGENKFAGFKYFELSDFLPQVQTIFDDLGLCGVVSFFSDHATLTVVDTESSESIIFNSTLADISLKACHPIQNLGAVQTYLRRYLWVMAMEIVEHDAVDGTSGKPENPKIITPKTDETPRKKQLKPGTDAWANAMEAYKRDGNLNAVKARAYISDEHQKLLDAEYAKYYEECERADHE